MNNSISPPGLFTSDSFKRKFGQRSSDEEWLEPFLASHGDDGKLPDEAPLTGECGSPETEGIGKKTFQELTVNKITPGSCNSRMSQNLLEIYTIADDKGIIEAKKVVEFANSDPFPFMELPFDVRCLIYEELYLIKQVINLSWSSEFDFGWVYSVSVGSTALLSTSRQVRDEAYHVLYGLNNFVYHANWFNRWTVSKFERCPISRMEPTIRKRISKIHIILGFPLGFSGKIFQ